MYTKIVLSQYGGPQNLQAIQEPTLPEPAPGEVRLKMLATSACFTDLLVISNQIPGRQTKTASLTRL